MYFKVFITQSWGKRLVQTENGVFRGALQFHDMHEAAFVLWRKNAIANLQRPSFSHCMFHQKIAFYTKSI